MGDCEGWMYPFLRFSFRNASSSFCSSGVKLYALNDLGWKPSLSSILWSQIRELRNQSAFFSSNTLMNSWYSSGICSVRRKFSFFSLCSRWNLMEFEVLVLIHTSSSSLISSVVAIQTSSPSSVSPTIAMSIFFSSRSSISFSGRVNSPVEPNPCCPLSVLPRSTTSSALGVAFLSSISCVTWSPFWLQSPCRNGWTTKRTPPLDNPYQWLLL